MRRNTHSIAIPHWIYPPFFLAHLGLKYMWHWLNAKILAQHLNSFSPTINKTMGRSFAEGSEAGSLRRAFDVEEFRENAHKMVDFIADYYRDIHKFPVCSQVQPGYLQTLIPDNAPDYPETLESVLTDVQNKIIPGITHWQSPNFFAFYPSNSSTAGLLGEMLSGGFNIVGFSWITSPAATELEAIVLNWLGKMLKLPRDFLLPGKGRGVIQGTASEAILVALLAARDRALKGDGVKSLEKLVVYTSDQTHSALQKACMIAGICKSNFRVLPTNASTNYALSPDIVQKAILDDIYGGFYPLFLCATVGTTSSSAVDSLKELGKISLVLKVVDGFAPVWCVKFTNLYSESYRSCQTF